MRLAARVWGKLELCDARKRHANGDRPTQHRAIHPVTYPLMMPVMMLVILLVIDGAIAHLGFRGVRHTVRYGLGSRYGN